VTPNFSGTVARMWPQIWRGTDNDWWEGESVVSACKHWPSTHLPEKLGKTENLTEDRWHTGQDWNCAPRDGYTKPCGL